MLNPDLDGISHINVYSKGRTNLGQFLSNFADCWVQTDDGPFRTIEGYWYWLSLNTDTIGRDELRDVSGARAKQLGRQMRSPDWNKDPAFQNKILKAIAIKVLSSEEWSNELRESTLPLVHYYVLGNGQIMELKEGLWILNFLEHLRAELKN